MANQRIGFYGWRPAPIRKVYGMAGKRLFGPQPGQQAKPVVLVEDNGPIHTSKCSLAVLAARAHWLTVEWLPKYAPELNEIEPV